VVAGPYLHLQWGRRGEWVDGCGLSAIYGQIQDFSGERPKMARWVWLEDPIYAFSEIWERVVRVWEVLT